MIHHISLAQPFTFLTNQVKEVKYRTPEEKVHRRFKWKVQVVKIIAYLLKKQIQEVLVS